jgi:formylmethanofuran dehydrogenase subunit E
MREHLPEDNYSMWKRHDDRQQAELDRLPRCHDCDEPIQQDMAIEFDGCKFCDECIKLYHLVEVVPE